MCSSRFAARELDCSRRPRRSVSHLPEHVSKWPWARYRSVATLTHMCASLPNVNRPSPGAALEAFLSAMRLSRAEAARLVAEHAESCGRQPPPASKPYNYSKWIGGSSRLHWAHIRCLLDAIRDDQNLSQTLSQAQPALDRMMECFGEREMTRDEVVASRILDELSGGIPCSSVPPPGSTWSQHASGRAAVVDLMRELVLDVVRARPPATSVSRCGTFSAVGPDGAPERWLWVFGREADNLDGLLARCVAWGRDVVHVVEAPNDGGVQQLAEGVGNVGCGSGEYRRVTLPRGRCLPWRGVLVPGRFCLHLYSSDRERTPVRAELVESAGRVARDLDFARELFRAASGPEIDAAPTAARGEVRFLGDVAGNSSHSAMWFAIPGFSQMFVAPDPTDADALSSANSWLFEWVNARRQEADRIPLSPDLLEKWRATTAWTASELGAVRHLCTRSLIRAFAHDGRLPRTDNFVGSGIAVDRAPYWVRYDLLRRVLGWVERLPGRFELAFEEQAFPSAWLLKPNAGSVYVVAPDRRGMQRDSAPETHRAMLVRLHGGTDSSAIGPFRSLFELRWNRARATGVDPARFLRGLMDDVVRRAGDNIGAGRAEVQSMIDDEPYVVLDWLRGCC